jgi:enoyl-CoA hydratase
MAGEIRVDRDGHVAEVVLARPEKRNALTFDMFDQIGAAFAELDADDSVRAVILRAEGPMFCAGLDLIGSAAALMSGEEGESPAQKSRRLYDLIKRLQKSVTAIAQCRQPVIAAVHDQCLGGGVDLITACDMRVCSADARFSVFETRVAIVADVGTLQRLTGVVGKGMAREMAFTGRKIAADRALNCNLVNEVFDDHDACLQGARALAGEIAANSPLAVQGTKRVMDYSDEHNTSDGLEFVAQWNTAFLQSHDLAEALGAFMERRPGNYTGK